MEELTLELERLQTAVPGLTPEAEAQRHLRFTKRLLVQRGRRIVERCLDLTPGEISHRLSAKLGRHDVDVPFPTPQPSPLRGL